MNPHGPLAKLEVSSGAIRARLLTQEGRKRIHAWRLELYGNLAAQPLSYAAERMRRLAELLDGAKAALRGADPQTKHLLRTEMRGHLQLAQKIAEGSQIETTLRQEVGPGTTLEAKGSLERLAEEMDALVEAGVVKVPTVLPAEARALQE